MTYHSLSKNFSFFIMYILYNIFLKKSKKIFNRDSPDILATLQPEYLNRNHQN